MNTNNIKLISTLILSLISFLFLKKIFQIKTENCLEDKIEYILSLSHGTHWLGEGDQAKFDDIINEKEASKKILNKLIDESTEREDFDQLHLYIAMCHQIDYNFFVPDLIQLIWKLKFSYEENKNLTKETQNKLEDTYLYVLGGLRNIFYDKAVDFCFLQLESATRHTYNFYLTYIVLSASDKKEIIQRLNNLIETKNFFDDEKNIIKFYGNALQRN